LSPLTQSFDAVAGSLSVRRGSSDLTDLRDHGHEVTALVRAPAQADTVTTRGAAAAVVVDLNDRGAVASVLSGVDAAIHTASPGDATSAALDHAVVDGAIDAFAGTGKPYVHVSGLWIYGANLSITEDSLFKAPALVAWKLPIQARLLDVGDVRGVVVVASTAYGDGAGGMPGLLLGSPRDDDGNLIMLGSGQQHWSTVHVADLADAFRRVLERESARGYYIIDDGLHPTLAELTEAAALAVGAPGAVPGSVEEARARVGAAFAEVLLLDQCTNTTKARDELDWRPSHSELVEELHHGNYRTTQVPEAR
jgi:nucleoside-diphosphate-sugar epimerase